LLIAGKVFSFWTLIVLSAVFAWLTAQARAGKNLKIRRIGGLDAMDEAVGRATEMGRPVHFSPGIVGLTYERSPQTLAGLAGLDHVAHLTARYNTPLVTTIALPDVYVMADDVVRQAYVAEGRPDAYKPDLVRFVGAEQFAYAAAAVGIMYREKVAANIMIGSWLAEALLLSEAGAQTGGIQITGTATVAQLPFMVVASDYCLIGEEIYAAGAYLSKDPNQSASVVGQDIAKAVTVAVLLLGGVLSLVKSPFLINLLAN